MERRYRCDEPAVANALSGVRLIGGSSRALARERVGNAHRLLEGDTYALCSMRCLRGEGDDRGGEVSQVQSLARPSRRIRGTASSRLLFELRLVLPRAA